MCVFFFSSFISFRFSVFFFIRSVHSAIIQGLCKRPSMKKKQFHIKCDVQKKEQKIKKKKCFAAH